MKPFRDVFGAEPELCAEAPGRVNLLGEHTDYNYGFVLPTAIPQKTRVCVRRSGRDAFRLYSANLDEQCDFTMQAPPKSHFATYVFGCLQEFGKLGTAVPALDVHVESQVPIGAGLSSSAALEVATLRALRGLFNAQVDDVEIAQLAQRAEIDHAHVNVGIMDQMASSLATETQMLYLDTRTLKHALLPLPAGTEILVLHSGVERSLASSAYNLRRSECNTAARMLGVSSLRDAQPRALSVLPEPYLRRARHVVSENTRVTEAANGVSAERFGLLMNASHASLRDDYEVSVLPLDLLVALLQGHDDVCGARLTGAGFGGACVALCKPGSSPAVARSVLADYATSGFKGSVLVLAG